MTEVTYITSASVDEVVNFYKEELLSNGWTDVKVTISFDEDYLNYTSVLIVISE